VVALPGGRRDVTLPTRTPFRERLSRYHADHTLILKALRERDPDAAQYHMRAHLINVTNNLLGSNTAWRTTGTERHDVIPQPALVSGDTQARENLDLGVLYGV